MRRHVCVCVCVCVWFHRFNPLAGYPASHESWEYSMTLSDLLLTSDNEHIPGKSPPTSLSTLSYSCIDKYTHAPQSTMREKYTQDDPRIKPLPISTYLFTPLPHSSSANDIVKLSIIPTTSMSAPRIAFTPAAKEGEMIDTPSWSFLVEKGDWAGMFDLGLRVDVENEPKWVFFSPPLTHVLSLTIPSCPCIE
jgi:hypothetical protein